VFKSQLHHSEGKWLQKFDASSLDYSRKLSVAQVDLVLDTSIDAPPPKPTQVSLVQVTLADAHSVDCT